MKHKPMPKTEKLIKIICVSFRLSRRYVSIPPLTITVAELDMKTCSISSRLHYCKIRNMNVKMRNGGKCHDGIIRCLATTV